MGGGVEVILSGGSDFAFGDTWARGWFGVFLGSPWGFLAEAGLGSRDAPEGGMWQNKRGAVSCFEARYPFLVLKQNQRGKTTYMFKGKEAAGLRRKECTGVPIF